MPNSSARCAQLPRAVDKVPFYSALKKFRDFLRGEAPDFNEADVTFPEVKLQNFTNKRIKVNISILAGRKGWGHSTVNKIGTQSFITLLCYSWAQKL